ncbi:MAG: carboxypeptidase regulatory-like domain-containing protein, partial [Muribaculaceae bacterium]|nr:carboxypeptidase regulatory-like domain-containing protein [Muribaculaceae bacterium]
YRYAYILSDRDASETYNHDAWLFSPSVHLNGSQEYKVEFFSYLAPGLNVMEKLEVSIMDAADPDAIVATLGIVDDNEAEWKYNEYKWTPEKSGDYVIGFHSESSNQGNGTLIDDVRISSGPLSSYLGAIGVDMGETDLVADYFTSTYAVRNTGEAAMDINLIAASPEIKVKGLPCTVEPYGYKELTIEFTPKALGAYKGEFILSTSDLSHPEVPLIVISNVRDVPVRRYHLEDFEEGGPKGWKMNAGAVNTDFKGGHNGPRSFYVRSFYTLDDETEVGFTTHYCDMGDNPEFSFWYKLTDCDLMGAESGPTGPEYPIIDVFVTDDFGKTWSKVYSISPDGSTAHKPSSEFQQIKVALPAYAGKRCRAKVQLKHAGDPLINDFILLMDDVALGTQPETDLKVTSFYGGGNAQAGEKTTFHGVVTNLGKEQSGEYVVKLSDSDGKEIKALSCRPLGGGESVSFDLDWIPVDAGNYHLVASLSEPNDVNIDNNISNFLKINVANSDQSQVNVGSGQLYLSNGLPIDFTAKETKVQTIYYANELGIDSGEIASLSFWSVFDYEHLTDNFEVYIAETDRYDFDDEEIIPDSCFTKVFSGNMFLPPQEYAFTVPFEQPYKYHGGNIVLMTTKCSNEFINTKRFMVYLDEMHQRTISAKTFNAGSLSNEEDNSKEVSNVYAKVSFNLQKAPSGSVSGIVRGKEGNLLKDAKVSLDGTQRSTVSGRRGQYSLTEVSVGSRVLTASKYGYYPSLANVVEISEGSESKVDIELAPYPKVKLSGRVLTEDGQPIEGAKIVLEGYASYSTVTNGDGQYEIADIYGDTGDSYNLRIESLHFQTAWNHDLMIGKEDFHYDATLKADVQPAFNVSAVEREDGLYLNWEMPLVEFKHDNGVPETYLGWNHGHAAAAIFSTYRQKILVKQISFY